MPISAPDPLLDIAGLSTGYGKIGVLRGVDLDGWRGRGGGAAWPKRRRQDHAVARGIGTAALVGTRAFRRARSRRRQSARYRQGGLSHVIEGHRVFTQLSVLDNLLLAAYDLPRGERAARVEEVFALFPEIAAKRHERAAALSGGQQQILAVAQGLVRRPRPAHA